jgi:hypothetical protein
LLAQVHNTLHCRLQYAKIFKLLIDIETEKSCPEYLCLSPFPGYSHTDIILSTHSHYRYQQSETSFSKKKISAVYNFLLLKGRPAIAIMSVTLPQVLFFSNWDVQTRLSLSLCLLFTHSRAFKGSPVNHIASLLRYQSLASPVDLPYSIALR